MTRYIFLDIDGTLVDYNSRMPDSARDALLRAKAAGHKLLLATGRLAGQIYPWLTSEIEFDGLLTSSGAMVKYGGKRIASSFFPSSELRELKRKLDEIGAILLCHTDEFLCAEPGTFERETEFFLSCGLKFEQFASLLERTRTCDVASLTEVEKIAYLGARPLDEMRELLGDGFKIDAFSFSHVPSTCGEVTLAGVSKAAGIEALITALGVDRAATVAIGDGNNDLDMVRYAGVGIAMGNAKDELKLAADFVTRDISDGGIAHAIDLILEGKL